MEERRKKTLVAIKTPEWWVCDIWIMSDGEKTRCRSTKPTANDMIRHLYEEHILVSEKRSFKTGIGAIWIL